VAVAFMGVSLLVMLATIFLALFTPGEVGYPACAAIYAIKVYAERKCGIVSPLSIGLLTVYSLLTGSLFLGIDSAGYAGVVVFSFLGMLVGVLLAMGKPFTTFYSRGRGEPLVHKVVSWIWLTAYAGALVTTLALMPSPAFVIAPAVICLVAALAMLFVNFVWCGSGVQRKSRMEREDLTFSEITKRSADFEAFCQLYGRSIATDPKQNAGNRTGEEVAEVVRKSEIAMGNDSIVFVCKKGDEVIGGMRCVLDRKGRPFSTEADINSSFDPLRKHGNVMLIGRLSVAEEHRGRPDIISGLFNGFVNLALERDISFVVSAGFRHGLPMYFKLGFDFLFDRHDARHGVRMSHGFVSHPIVLDFRAVVLSKADDEVIDGVYSGQTNKFLAERWFKRFLLRRFVRRLLSKHELSSIEDIRQAMATAQPLVSQARAVAVSGT